MTEPEAKKPYAKEKAVEASEPKTAIAFANTPEAMPRGLTILLTIAAAFIVIAGMRAFASTIGPLFLALVIVVVVAPIQPMLRRRGWPGWLSTVVLLFTCFGVLFTIVGLLVWSASELVALIATDTYSAKLGAAQQDLITVLERLGVSEQDIQTEFQGLDVGAVAQQVVSALSGVLGVASAISLLLIATIFIVMDAAQFSENLSSLSSQRPRIVEAIQGFAQQTRTYFVVSTVFGVIVAALDVAALIAFGIPLALVWGVLSIITNYIPNVGFVIGLVPPALLGFLEGGWQQAFWLSVTYFAINFVVQSLIQPRYVGDAVGLSASLTFISLIFWGWVLGPLGALLAVPMTLLAKALLVDIDPAAAWLKPLISLGSIDAESTDVESAST